MSLPTSTKEIQAALRDTNRRIGDAHACLTADIEMIRHKQKDLAVADLNIRARWARYTLETWDLEMHRLMLMRQLEIAEMVKPVRFTVPLFGKMAAE